MATETEALLSVVVEVDGRVRAIEATASRNESSLGVMAPRLEALRVDLTRHMAAEEVWQAAAMARDQAIMNELGRITAGREVAAASGRNAGVAAGAIVSGAIALVDWLAPLVLR
jgi:hypothetical protein